MRHFHMPLVGNGRDFKMPATGEKVDGNCWLLTLFPCSSFAIPMLHLMPKEMMKPAQKALFCQ
jgi:hypothetical protein